MSGIRSLYDGLINFTSRLGTARDKASSTTYADSDVSPDVIDAMYKTSWLARRMVDKIPSDATRKWRQWSGDDAQQVAIEAEEKRLKVKQRVGQALRLAYKYGGAVIYMDDGTDQSQPMRKGGKNSLRFITVMKASDLTPDGKITDPLNADYGRFMFYSLKKTDGEKIPIHRSRFVFFAGAENDVGNPDFGQSVLISSFTAITQFEGTCANVNSMVYEAKIDVMSVDGLVEQVSTEAGESALVKRYSLVAQTKGNNQMIVLDKEKEEYSQKQMSFAGLTDIVETFRLNVAGAAEMPRAILFGTPTGGLGSTGQLELSTYYDGINDMQENFLQPSIEPLDNALVHSALGSYPSDLFYDWRPLWQMSAMEKVEMGHKQAEIIRIVHETDLFSDDEIRSSAVSMFDESGVLTGLDTAVSTANGDDDNNDPLDGDA